LSASLIAPSVGLMTEFLVELSMSPTKIDSIADLVTCARIAAQEQSASRASRLPSGEPVAIAAMYLEAIVSRA
jgi:hypothetical protein